MALCDELLEEYWKKENSACYVWVVRLDGVMLFWHTEMKNAYAWKRNHGIEYDGILDVYRKYRPEGECNGTTAKTRIQCSCVTPW